jgi:hypothetical protein
VPRIHILGASGSGTTTLGAELAARNGWMHEDSDRYFWEPTDPPFTTKRTPEARMALLLPRLRAGADWVFTGSAVRMARLRAREARNFGARIAPGGDMHAENVEFLAWAEAYDTAGPSQRSRVLHAAWLAERSCQVVRLDSAAPVAVLAERVEAWLAANG